MAFRTNKVPVLQTKSASGAVATFNTALAMPLASCNIAVNAWQEGSGDPSPSNVRPIHGFSEVNACHSKSKNLADVSTVHNFYIKDGINERSGLRLNLIKGTYTFSVSSTTGTELFISRKINGEWTANTILVGSPYYVTLECDGYVDVWVSLPYSFNDVISEFMVERGNIKHAYEPYVTPTIYPIQLGQEVYGAEVDVVNGVAHVTHGLDEYDGSSDENWVNYSAGNGYYIQIADMENVNNADVISNYLPAYSGLNNLGIRLGFNNNYAYMYQVNTIDGVTDLASWRSYLQSNPLTFVYPLAEPFDIQLTPTQIETLIGNNTIFADTGDVDLTYKDLDIAKRGNFREVFRLPS